MYARYISFSLQLLVWVFFLGLPFLNNPEHFQNNGNVMRFFIKHLLYVILFYANYFYLIPRLLKKKGLNQYITAAIILMVVMFVLAALSEGWWIKRVFAVKALMGFIPIFQMYALSTTFRLTLDYFEQLLAQKKLEEQKRIAEINFLRSQINPHFLFNTLNNITALIRLDPQEAERSIGTLSDLMRYMLNSGTEEKVELGKEIDYIRNYVELQKLRLDKDFKLNYHFKIEKENTLIEPLLLIGFVENTFKHGVSGTNEDFIDIYIESKGEHLTLKTQNKLHLLKNINEIASGVGLENTKKRLTLCYKNKYALELQTSKGIYDLTLRLQL